MHRLNKPSPLFCSLSLALQSILLPALATAQWSGATRDTLTRNTLRDETAAQSLVCDEGGNLHVAWEQAVQTGGWRIFYAVRPASGAWSLPREVGDSSLASYQPALAVESSARTPYIVFRATYATSDEIVIARDSAGGWERTRLTTNNTSEYNPTIAADRNGKVHVAWIGRDALNNWKMFYSENITGNWRTQLLAASELGDFGSGAAPFVAVTSTGVAHIFYRGGNYPAYRIHHASIAQPGDTTWTYETISTPNGADYTSRVVVDESGTLHLLATGNDGFGYPPHVYYLKKPSSGTWSAPELANTGGTGSGGSLIIDRFGKGHITWDEVSGNIITGNLYYASNRNGTWSSMPVQLDGSTFNGVLAVDATGRGHILVYHGATFQTQEIVVIHSDGLVTEIEEEAQGTPNAIILHQNYPSPFNPSTTITYQLSAQGHVTLKVFDVLGREAATLVNDVKQPGTHTVEFDGIGLASGVYFYRMMAGSFFETKKLVLLK
jgi:hypothetical protein